MGASLLEACLHCVLVLNSIFAAGKNRNTCAKTENEIDFPWYYAAINRANCEQFFKKPDNVINVNMIPENFNGFTNLTFAQPDVLPRKRRVQGSTTARPAYESSGK